MDKRTAEIITAIDQESRVTSFRIGERPGAGGFGLRKKGTPQPPEITRARTRARTRQWRVENDRRRRPEVSVVAQALLVALVGQQDFDEMLESDWTVVGHALVILQRSGYDIAEAKRVMKRFRHRVLQNDKLLVRPVDEAAVAEFDKFDEDIARLAASDRRRGD
jgi:hypothetical protein